MGVLAPLMNSGLHLNRDGVTSGSYCMVTGFE